MTTLFDRHNKKQITVEIVGPSYEQKIVGEGYFIIINPDSKFVSFSKSKKDVCLGDVTKDIIPNYTNQQFADEYGDRRTGLGKSVREFMQQECRMDIKSPCSDYELKELIAYIKEILVKVIADESFYETEEHAKMEAIALKKLPYDFELDDDCHNYCIKATMPEIWEYHLSRLNKLLFSNKKHNWTVIDKSTGKPNRLKVQWATREHIVGEGAIKEFFYNCIFGLKLGIGFHPDTDFTEYIFKEGKKAGKRIFTDSEAVELNKTLQECFEQCKKHNLDIKELWLPKFQMAFDQLEKQAVK